MRDAGNGMVGAFNAFVAFLPTLIGALLLLIVGWIIAWSVAKLVRKGLTAAGFDRAVTTLDRDRRFSHPRWTGSRIVAELVKWFVFLLFVLAAANVLGMPQITAVMQTILLFIPRVIVAAAIVVIGLLLARLLASVVAKATSEYGTANATLVSKIVEYGVFALAVIAALDEVQVATVVINTLFIAVVGAAALAAGLAFGLGGRGVAAEITQSWYDRSRRDRRRTALGAEDRVRRLGGV